MAGRMFGVETEYAFAALDERKRCLPPEGSVGLLWRAAASGLPHLKGHMDSRLYLQNGACMYVDCGLHPEYATPECTNPWEAVRHVSAGERILASLRERMVSSSAEVAEAFFLRSNVCYSSGATWGCHESYLHRADPDELSMQIIPHLVTRLVYTGAGGFDNTSSRLRFILSPRVPHMMRAVSNESTMDRGIFHTKNEPLCRGHNRLHLLCGESLCSQTASFLKIGATALVVAMIEGGLRPGDAVRFVDPLVAMQRFSGDVNCRAEVKGLCGEPLTALRVQRHYLEFAESNSGAPFMPDWAPAVCVAWRSILDRLECAPGSVDRTLDWAIKHSLYSNFARERGVDWSRMVAPEAAPDVSRETPGEENDDPVMRRARFYRAIRRGLDQATGGLLEMEVPAWLAPQAASRCPAPGEPDAPAGGGDSRFRHEICEIDARYGQIASDGVFASMDSSGTLDHRVEGVGDPETAVTEPPALGRARVRGEVIRRVAAEEDRYRCSWDVIEDTKGRRLLDLGDPWIACERWSDLAARSRPREG